MDGSPRSWRSAKAWLVLAPLLGMQFGCYTYQPVSTVTIGDKVRARLTTEEAIRQSEITNDPVIELEGTVAGTTDERIRLQVITARGQSRLEAFTFKTDYNVPRAGIVALGKRELSPWRSLGMGAVVGGLLYLILDTTVIGSGGDGPGDNTQNQARILDVRIGR